MFDATPCMRREPMASTRACSTASNRARAGGLCGARRRCSASLWQASLRAKELARPRTIAASRGLGLRGGSGRRALAPSGEAIRDGLSAEKAISSSGRRASARVHEASARLNGSFGISALPAGLRLVALTLTLDIRGLQKAGRQQRAAEVFYRPRAKAAARRAARNASQGRNEDQAARTRSLTPYG